jgi:hypothetical protein
LRYAENRLLHITTLRLKAAALWHINQWKQALQAVQQAKYLLDERDKQDKWKQKSVVFVIPNVLVSLSGTH